MARVKHVARSVERHVLAPRRLLWRALLEHIEAAAGPYATPGRPAPHGVGAELRYAVGDRAVVETVLSFEPPWRRAAQLDGTPLELLQMTFVLRDDGDESHLAAAVVADPEPTSEGWAFVEDVLAALEQVVEEVGAAAELAEATPHE